MDLEEVIQRANNITDSLLVKFAEEPSSRFLFSLPSLVEGEPTMPVMDCLEYRYAISRLREVITYKYILNAIRTKRLAVSRSSLGACLRCMRQSPVIDYYDLGDYHEYAFSLYKQEGKERQARRHLLSCYMDRGRAILSAGKTFDCKELIMVMMKDHRRLQGLLVYMLSFIHYDFEELQGVMRRSQYLMLELSLVLAVKLFAENVKVDAEVRQCVYHVQSCYYDRTGRTAEAEQARKACQQLGGDVNYDLALVNFMMSQPDARREDEWFADYLLYRDSIDDADIYPLDENGDICQAQPTEDPIVEKDGAANFMDAHFRFMPDAIAFVRIYERAELGDEAAIGELVHRFREGDGVTACSVAADAWAKRL